MHRWWCHTRSAWRSSGPGSTTWQRSWSYWSTSPWSHNAPYRNINMLVSVNQADGLIIRAAPEKSPEAELSWVSPEFERLGRDELQRVRWPVKVNHVEFHRRVGLTRLDMKHSRDKSVNATVPLRGVKWSWRLLKLVLLPPASRGQLLYDGLHVYLWVGILFSSWVSHASETG